MKEMGRSKKQKREGRRQKNIDRRSKHLDLPGKVSSPICPPHYSRNRNMRKYPDYKPHDRPMIEIDSLDDEWGDVLEALE